MSEYINSNGSGTAMLAAHFEYDPFGNLTAHTKCDNLGSLIAGTAADAANLAYRFSTKPQDPVTGLLYYEYRWYDPLTGRWPSRDPIGERGGVNHYGFVGNDSVRRSDRLGLKRWVEDGFVHTERELTLPNGSKCNVDCVKPSKKAMPEGRTTCEARDMLNPGGDAHTRCEAALKEAEKDPVVINLKAALSHVKPQNAQCKVPSVQCRCCTGPCKSAGGWNLGGEGIYICEDTNPDKDAVVKILRHELAHQLQICRKMPFRGCREVLKRELEAYKTEGLDFQQALQGAVWSSCMSGACSTFGINNTMAEAMLEHFESNLLPRSLYKTANKT